MIAHLPLAFRMMSYSGVFGATMIIALFDDLTSLLMVHVWVFYNIAASIYSWQLSNLISLFYLFRGSKRNVLRNRIDACEYDVEQLLLGTVLFTVLFFLFPTTAAYYVLFSGVRLRVTLYSRL